MSPATAARSRAWVAMVCVAAVTLTGCGEDEADTGLSAEEQTAADNLAAQIVTSGSVAGRNTVTAVQAGCIADGTVGKIGLKRLQRYQIVTDDLKVNKGIQGVKMRPKDADSLAGVFIDCMDTEKLFEKQLLSSGSSARLTAKQKRCVRDAVDEKAVAEVLSLSFQGETTRVYDGLQTKLTTCTPGNKAGQESDQ